MVDQRVEKDSLGDVYVPAGALYGAQTQRAVENFPISGLTMPRGFIRALGLIKGAAAHVNAGLGDLDEARAEAIVRASAEVAAGRWDSEFPVDVFQTGSGTSSNMNADEVIANRASALMSMPGHVHPNDHVNLGQSSNDVIPSAIHIAAAIEARERLLPGLRHLGDAIVGRIRNTDHITKTGRTHLMDAMPVRFGQELGGWKAQIDAGIARIETTLLRVQELALGGTAVGTGVNAHPEFGRRVAAILTEKTGIQLSPSSNYFMAISSQDAAVELSGQLRTVACSLMKIANDLRWMNSGPNAGLGEISLPPIQPGSSIMPGKVNPVIPEAVCMVAAQVMGNDVTIGVAGQAGNFQLNAMLPVIAYNLLQSIDLLGNAAVTLADKAIVGFTVNEAHIASLVGHNPILVTALTRVIGYDLGAQIAKKAYAEKRSVQDVALELTDLSAEQLSALLDPRKLTDGGI